MTLKEREVLFQMGGSGPAEGAIVNIGSYLGGSSIILAKGSKQIEKRYIPSILKPVHSKNITWQKTKVLIG